VCRILFKIFQSSGKYCQKSLRGYFLPYPVYFQNRDHLPRANPGVVGLCERRTFKVRSTSTPSYLRLLIQDREHGRNLRSTTMALYQPFTTTTFAKRAFRCSAPAVWNSLPQTVLISDSVAVFKLRLKTFLFSQAFSSFSAH